MAGQVKFSSDIPRFWPDKQILNFQVFNRDKLVIYLCLKHHTHAATRINYISETGIPNILLCLRRPFRVNSLCSVATRNGSYTQLLQCERYEVLKN